ncbi:hypothetical protein G6F56_002735 [Rhizopus delemar]|uniref:Uncharacterized protein n=1 Tax=Rhizopus stolonifer TaxID=4846 RepID=A0A367K201_RHIST|nr:hypothetical protein G6F56_002735 [Rhizopus delemar]RCH96272.1 hypothetical protein CU098_006830 [Rhizopus stolonifer]
MLTKRVCEHGIEYNREIKHHLQNDEISSQELDFPHRLAARAVIKEEKHKAQAMSDQDFKFAQYFKNKSHGPDELENVLAS